MKASGIVRRIDDLGRVVIPKEINFIQENYQQAPYASLAKRKHTEKSVCLFVFKCIY